MKTLLLAWLTINGQIIPGSIVTAAYPTMEECQAKGQEIKATLDGKKTLTTADYRCSVIGVSL